MNFKLNDFGKNIICENEVADTVVETVVNGDTLDLYVSANEDKVKFIELQWCFKSDENLYVLGDAWERSYGELEFKKLCNLNRFLPWYFIATDKQSSFCFGVKTGANAFVSFKYTTNGIKALIDCRNGGCGVELKGRKLHLQRLYIKNILTMMFTEIFMITAKAYVISPFSQKNVCMVEITGIMLTEKAVLKK